MTIKDVIKFIAKSRNPTKQEVKDWLDSQCGEYCPLTFVAKVKLGEEFSTDEYAKAAKLLKVKKSDAKLIVEAADGEVWDDEPGMTIRKQLFSAVGLNPKDA